MRRYSLGIDGGIAFGSRLPVVQTIGQATETNTAHSVQANLSTRVARMGIDGGIGTTFDPDYSNKQQILGIAVETDTAFSVVDPNDVVQAIGIAGATEVAFSVSAGLTPTITSVSSSRGTNIVTANETLTLNVDDSTGITQVTVNGTQCSVVTIVTGTEVTCEVPLGVGAQYFSNQDVIATNSFGASPAFSAAWEPPFGMVETDFTVDYASLDPDSPFAGDTTFQDLVAGDSCIYDSVTSPDSLGVSMDGAGQFTITGTVSQVQTFDYYIYDLSDNTVSATIEQITVHPGPIEATIGQASETNTAHPVSSIVVVTQQIGLAVENSTARSVNDGSAVRATIGQATETSSAFSVSVAGPVQTIAIGQASSTDAARSVSDGSTPTATVGLASETSSAFTVIDAQAISAVIGQAIEINMALDVDFPASLDSIRDQIEALEDIVLTLQAKIDELYIRTDLDKDNPQTYERDGKFIKNNVFRLDKIDNDDKTFTMTRQSGAPD